MFALAIVLSYVESLVPTIVPVPGIKLGLSNIVTMYCLFFINAPCALLLAVLKSGFVFITRGATAALLSAAGGICSVAAMAGLRKLDSSDGLVSVTGAITHNLAQLCVSYFLLGTVVVFYYVPVLLISGIIMGVITISLLNVALPAINRASGTKK